MLDQDTKDILSQFGKLSLRPPAWIYAHAAYPLKKQGCTFASDGHDPRSADNSLGYLRRWLVVPFDTTLNKSITDRAIIDKLTTPDELSGLLNRAVAKHRRLLESGALTESEKMARASAASTGQIVQVVQKQCRINLLKVHCLPKLDRPSLSFEQCR